MALRTLELEKQGHGYRITENEGSNYRKDTAVYESPSRADAEGWLRRQGGAPDLVDQALDDADAKGKAVVKIVGNYDEAEGFPKS